jgi:hypothetical protein
MTEKDEGGVYMLGAKYDGKRQRGGWGENMSLQLHYCLVKKKKMFYARRIH